MGDAVIKVENLSKLYRLGVWGTGTLKDDIKKNFAKWTGRQDPTVMVGSNNQLDMIDEQEVWALKDINFEVKQGEVLGIIGKNGAGKSTLLKILSEITAPTTGAVKIKGRVASLLEVGTGMHPELTGRENIYLNGAILGMKRWEIKSKFDEIVEFAGIAKYIDTPIKRYSSGMRVRLGFAIAAFLEPEILIVDEVLAVGDAEFQSKAIGKMQDISKGGGRTVLFVSHNMNTIERLCQNSMILENGRLKSIGETSDQIDIYYNKSIGGDLNRWMFNIESDKFKNISDYLFIESIFIWDDNKNQIIEGSIRRDQLVTLKIKVKITKKIKNLTLGVSLFSSNGDLLWRTLCTDADPQLNVFSEGDYFLIYKIPTELLNEGLYYFVIDGGIYKASWDFNPITGNPPRVTFEIFGGFSSNIFWQNKRIGLLAPKNKWEIEKI